MNFPAEKLVSLWIGSRSSKNSVAQVSSPVQEQAESCGYLLTGPMSGYPEKFYRTVLGRVGFVLPTSCSGFLGVA
jgi:hypothetical protein